MPSTIASCSSSISNRSLVDGNGMPNAACSRSYQPAPRPSSTRPPLIASACATWIASTPGRRNVTGVTSVPSRIRLVSRPSAARVIHASVEPGPGEPSPIRR